MCRKNRLARSRNSRTGKVRYSLLTLLLIITVASVGLGWWVTRKPYVATAYLMVQPRANSSFREQEVFRATQLALINSDFVLNTALSRAQISQLNCVAGREDALSWLREVLEVSFPGDGEILEVRLRGKEANMAEYCLVLDAVVKAYTDEVVFKARFKQSESHETYQKLLSELRSELEDKIDRFSALKEELQPAEGEIIAKLTLLEEEIASLKQVTREMEVEIRRRDIQEKAEQSRIRVMQYSTLSRQ